MADLKSTIVAMNRRRNAFRSRPSWNWTNESTSSFPGDKTGHTDQKRRSQEEVRVETVKLEHGLSRKTLVGAHPLQRRSTEKVSGPRKDFDATLRLRFQKAVRILIKVLNLSTPNKSQVNSMSTGLTFLELGKELLDDSGQPTYGEERLTFDLTVFKAQKERLMHSDVRMTLSMEPRDRSEEQLHVTIGWIQRAVEAFSDFPPDLQRSLVMVGCFEAKRIIIREGHKAENFYFILSGEVVVSKMAEDDGSKVSFLTTLGRGNSFGDLALIHHAKRSATVTCRSDVELLAVGREDYVDIFMHIENGREPDFISFLRQRSLLAGWPIDTLPWDKPRICMAAYFRRGEVLAKSGHRCDWIYVLKSGSCSVLVQLQSVQPRTKNVDRRRHSITEISDEWPDIKGNPSDVDRLKRSSPVFTRIRKLTNGDTFGLESVVFNAETPSWDCSLVSDGAEVIVISRRFFLHNATPEVQKNLLKTVRPYPSVESLQEKLQVQADWVAFKDHIRESNPIRNKSLL